MRDKFVKWFHNNQPYIWLFSVTSGGMSYIYSSFSPDYGLISLRQNEEIMRQNALGLRQNEEIMR